MNIAYTFIQIIGLAIMAYYFYKLVCCFATIHELKILKFLVPVGLFFITPIVIFNGDIVNVSYALIGFILIMLISFQGGFIKKLSAVFVLYPLVVSLNFLTYYTLFLLYPTNQSIVIDKLLSLLQLLITILFWYLVYHIFQKKIVNAGNYLTNQMWLIIDVICLAPLISIVTIIICTDNNDIVQIFPIAIASIFTNLGIMYLVGHMVHNVQINLENQNLHILNSYYKELENNQTEIRKLRHDINNQLAAIGNLITSGNIEEAKDYFDTLSYVVAGSNRVFCKNGIVNAVLNVKYNLATEYNIDCFLNIDIDSVLGINAIDLCSLFANTLDNALEASMQIEEPPLRKIEVKARCDKGYFSYQISNNKSNKITIINNCYISSKTDVKSHGFGIKTIKDIVQKYNGTLDITYTETEFTVLVIISNQGNSK